MQRTGISRLKRSPWATRGEGRSAACVDTVGATRDLDPRVEELLCWAGGTAGMLGEAADAALLALEQSPPRAQVAPSLALAAAAAYSRVPTIGPRNLDAGHRIVELLGKLGEPGARELVRLRERTRYSFPRAKISKVLARQMRELQVPLGELEDGFTGPALDADLAMQVEVGSYAARLQASDDLRRVRTSWLGPNGTPLRRRPAQARAHPRELELVESERRRLRAHLADLRSRLEGAMATGRSWTVETWVERMFADPLRAAMARRLIWRIEETDALVLPSVDGLRDASGEPVRLPPRTNLSIWHPADSEAEQRRRWQRRLDELAIDQPIDQAGREVTAPDPDSPTMRVGTGTRVPQRRFRGFLLKRGWHVPYLGPFFDVPEATFEPLPGGPIAVLDLDVDNESDEIIIGELHFRSVEDKDLDARLLPPAMMSEAARDVLGAAATV